VGFTRFSGPRKGTRAVLVRAAFSLGDSRGNHHEGTILLGDAPRNRGWLRLEEPRGSQTGITRYRASVGISGTSFETIESNQ
jgi:hypothetical protein